MNSNDVVAGLYQEHGGWLKGWLQRRLGCSSEAADLAQDTFVKVLSRNLDGIREPRAFLRTIAHGLMVDKVRRKELERAYLATLHLMPEELAPLPGADLLHSRDPVRAGSPAYQSAAKGAPGLPAVPARRPQIR